MCVLSGSTGRALLGRGGLRLERHLVQPLHDEHPGKRKRTRKEPNNKNVRTENRVHKRTGPTGRMFYASDGLVPEGHAVLPAVAQVQLQHEPVPELHVHDVHLGLEVPEVHVAHVRLVAQRAPEQEPRQGAVEERLELEHLAELQEVLRELLVVELLEAVDGVRAHLYDAQWSKKKGSKKRVSIAIAYRMRRKLRCMSDACNHDQDSPKRGL